MKILEAYLPTQIQVVYMMSQILNLIIFHIKSNQTYLTNISILIKVSIK